MADKSVNAKQGTAKSDAVLVADALLRASNRLAIAKKALSQIVGLSESSLSRLRKKDFELDGKSLELAIFLSRCIALFMQSSAATIQPQPLG